MSDQPTPELALREALEKITKAARSWHDYHHGSDIVGCDEICELLPECEAALAACLPPLDDDYVAWCTYKGTHSIRTCDSDTPGAFPVYRRHPMPTMDEAYRFIQSNPLTSREMLDEIERAAAQPVTAPAKEEGDVR